MNRRLQSSAAMLCIAVLAGCSSPGSGIAFKEPNGWRSTPGMFGRFQMWMSGSATQDRQIVMLVRGDKNTSATESQALSGESNVRDLKRDSIMLCGSQAADHYVAVGERTTNGKTVRERIEAVTATIGDSKYVAFYFRPDGMQPDAAAEAAIHSLCPAK